MHEKKLEALTSNLRVIEPFRSKDGVKAEVVKYSLGGAGCVVIQADTATGDEAEVTLNATEAHDLILWLQCALSMRPDEASCEPAEPMLLAEAMELLKGAGSPASSDWKARYRRLIELYDHIKSLPEEPKEHLVKGLASAGSSAAVNPRDNVGESAEPSGRLAEKASVPPCGNPVMVNAERYRGCRLPSGHEGECSAQNGTGRMSLEKVETNAETILPIMERDYKARLAAAVDLIRDYYWCYSRAEGRRIDAKAEKFLDANGGRELPVSDI